MVKAPKQEDDSKSGGHSILMDIKVVWFVVNAGNGEQVMAMIKLSRYIERI